MLQNPFQKIIATILILLALAGIGYYLFTSAEVPAVSTEFSDQAVLGQDIIILANKVENISFDQSVFASAVFASLVDYQLSINAEVKGRNNPFGAIGTEGVPVNNTKSQAVTETE